MIVTELQELERHKIIVAEFRYFLANGFKVDIAARNLADYLVIHRIPIHCPANERVLR